MSVVLKIFEDISKIPRGSGNEKGISDYLMAFAKERGLEAKQDALLNVVIYKPGTSGKENNPPLALQSHMDMVCEKNSDTVHDFLKDPIKLRQEGDLLYATNTTLGADDGVGMALTMAILDSADIPHPPIEAIFTTEEETGMAGMAALDPNWISARRMINMDSGNDSTFGVGCSGGTRGNFIVPVTRDVLPAGMVFLHLSVRGLFGGHSGTEIHLERANSISILGRALAALNEQVDVRIVKLSGGLKANAIPREADAYIAIPAADENKAKQIIADLKNVLGAEYRGSDPDISLELTQTDQHKEAFTPECVKKVISAIILIPGGVINMSRDIDGLVETSNNVGVMETGPGAVTFECAIRSSVPSRGMFVRTRIEALAAALGATAEFGDGYPSWTYNPDSPLLKQAMEIFREVHKKEPNIEATHGGLECGFMMRKFPDMDIIAFMSNVFDYHTPNEHLSISSLDKVWKYTQVLVSRL